MRIRYLITKLQQISLFLINSFKSYQFIKAIDHIFYGFPGVINSLGPFGRILEKLVNHSPAARDLQAFLLFSQHPAWVYHARKPIENAVSL